MNGEKTCTRCGESHSLSMFRENARYADGRVSWCNQCAKSYRAQYYQKNKGKVKEQNAAWHASNKDARNEAMKAAYRNDKERHIERARDAKKRNPAKYREANRLNAKQRRDQRIDLRIRSRISSQIRYCLGTGKGGNATEQLLGYSIIELRKHLEKQFLPGMDWKNIGEWHIDHIIPLSSFIITGASDPELRRAWSLTNLRPLWAKDNIRKGAKIEVLL